MPNFPANPVALPDCQQNWEYLQKQLTSNGSSVAFGTVVALGEFVKGTTLLSFTNIPQTFTHLRVEFIAQSGRAGVANTGMRFSHNSVGAASWEVAVMAHSFAAGATPSVSTNDTRGYLGQCPAGNRTSDNYTLQGVMDIPYYSRSDAFHHFLVHSMMDDGNTDYRIHSAGNTYRGNANAITRLDIFDDVTATLGPRTRASLYGIK